MDRFVDVVCRAGTGSALPAAARRSTTVRALQLGEALSVEELDIAFPPGMEKT